jgi:hypothetical protein
MDLDAKAVAAQKQDNLRRPAYFGPSPQLERSTRTARLTAVLMTYCTPRIQYDGISAYEIAQRIIDAWDDPKPEGRPDALRDPIDHTA